MSEQESERTLQLARELVDHLPKELQEMNDDLKKLILRAENEHDPMVEIEIIDLLSSHEITRHLMREQNNSLSGQKDITLGGESFSGPPSWAGAGLAGNPSWISPNQKWFCPESKCDYWTLVIQDGEDPPTCKKHKTEMVRKYKKKG